MAIASGMPDYSWLTVPHPHDLGGEWSDAEARQIAKDMAPLVYAALTQPSTPARDGTRQPG